MHIKLFFEKFIHGGIEVKRKTRGPVHAKAAIEVKTAGTIQKKSES